MSRVLSPPDDRPSAYDKFVMDKWIKTENTQNIFIHEFPGFLISYFSKTLILDRKELILDKEGEILSLKLRDFLS